VKQTKTLFIIATVIFFSLSMQQCKNDKGSKSGKFKILFLHHSTGEVIYRGGSNAKRIRGFRIIGKEFDVPAWFTMYNKENGTSYQISDRVFPKGDPYQWNNYPYDYYNIWVKHAGEEPYMEEPTLEMLTKEYNLIIFKHCYPVCDLKDTSVANIEPEEKTIENYKIQYEALKNKLHEFPNTKFILWTGAARVKSQIDSATAMRAKNFFNWVRFQWDSPYDNIYLWDFYELETAGALYLKDEYTYGNNDSHPNKAFGAKVAPLFCQRIVDVIENNGLRTTLTGEYK